MLFPIFLVLLSRLPRDRRIASMLLCVAAAFLFSVWGTVYKPFAAFYLLPTRGWELLIGSFLALEATPKLTNRMLRELSGIVGLGLIAWAVFSFDRETLFPGANALCPCVGAWLIIYSGAHGDSLLKAILSGPALVFVGAISYSLYLWHWPVLVFGRFLFAGPLDITTTAGALIVSFCLSIVSYRFVESPFRGQRSPISRQQLFSAAAVVSVTCIGIGAAAYATGGMTGR